MDTLPRVLTFMFLVAAMLGVGMQTTTGDLRLLMESKGFFARSLLANFVVVPIIGIVLARSFPLEPRVAAAFLLLACTPGGFNALQFTTKMKGKSSFAGIIGLLMCLLAIFLSPVLLDFVVPHDISLVIPYRRALLFALLFLLIPMLAGALLRSQRELLAEKLSKPCAIISAVLFFAVSILTMGIRKEAMHAVGRRDLLCMLLFIVISMTVGWLLGGPASGTRRVLATVTGMRNVALCLLIAANTLPDPTVQTPLVAFSALMLPPNMLLTAYTVIRSR